MTAITKPDFENIWASEGGMSSPTLAQLLEGWRQNQIPPSEIANYMQNRVESAIEYIFQVGLPDWDEKVDYRVSSLVNRQGKYYKSKTVNKGIAPESSEFDWVLAFDAYGASDDLRVTVGKIITEDGFLAHYVKRSDPVMLSKAKAPSFEAEVGVDKGYKFKEYDTGTSCDGGDLLLRSGGVTNGRIKSVAPTMEMDDNTLVTTALLKKVIDDITRKFQIPVGYSVITKSSKPPSDPDQFGYGTWVQDSQGRALVGVSANNAINVPEWTKDPDSVFGEYDHKMTIDELVEHDHPVSTGDTVTGNQLFAHNYGGNATLKKTEKSGGGKPFNVVQPSQTKYIWTRIS